METLNLNEMNEIMGGAEVPAMPAMTEEQEKAKNKMPSMTPEATAAL